MMIFNLPSFDYIMFLYLKNGKKIKHVDLPVPIAVLTKLYSIE